MRGLGWRVLPEDIFVALDIVQVVDCVFPQCFVRVVAAASRAPPVPARGALVKYPEDKRDGLAVREGEAREELRQCVEPRSPNRVELPVGQELTRGWLGCSLGVG